jgi:hypothetical protein
MGTYINTRGACRWLGVTEDQLRYLLRTLDGLAPARSPSGDYMWEQCDLERIQRALAERRTRKLVTA